MSDGDDSDLLSIAVEDKIHDFFQTFAFDVDGGLMQEKVDNLWDSFKVLSGGALLGRFCLNAYSMFSKLLMPQEKVDSIVDVTMLSYVEVFFWFFLSLGLLVAPGIRCTWLAFRMSLRTAAGWSALKLLEFMTVPSALKLWNLRLSNRVLGSFPVALFGFMIALSLIAYMAIGLAALMLKLEQIQFATDDAHSTLEAWTLSEMFKLLMFANQMVSLIDADSVKLETVFGFAFGRDNAKIDAEELDVKLAYEKRFLELVWASSRYNWIQKFLLTVTYDAANIQKLLIKNTAVDGVDDA